MFIPRVVFDQVGGFDEDYFMYGEDIDLCYKIKRAGYKVYYTPRTTAIHFKGESTRRSSMNQTYEFYRAMSVFVEKRYGVNTTLSRALRVAILLNRQARSLVIWFREIWPVLLDFTITVVAMFVGEFLRSHKIYSIPSYGLLISISLQVLCSCFWGCRSVSIAKTNTRSAFHSLPGFLPSFCSLP